MLSNNDITEAQRARNTNAVFLLVLTTFAEMACLTSTLPGYMRLLGDPDLEYYPLAYALQFISATLVMLYFGRQQTLNVKRIAIGNTHSLKFDSLSKQIKILKFPTHQYLIF